MLAPAPQACPDLDQPRLPRSQFPAWLTQVRAQPAAARDADGMSNPPIEIEGTLVARELGLEVDEFRRLMEIRKIKVLCERGTGEDAGFYRATFYHGDQRARFIIDRYGNPV